jgi:DNA-directed RNA polymerase specialized sigma24 family protein
MLVSAVIPPPVPDPKPAFLALLPLIEEKAQAAFRKLGNHHDREDAVAEVVARAWQAFSAAPGCAMPAVLTAAAIAAVRAAITAG